MQKQLLKLILPTFFFLATSLNLSAQEPLSKKQVDSLVKKTMKTFDVPGIAVAIIKDGKVVLSEGYGVHSEKNGGKVDENTLFGIASNTKAFTAAAIGKLVDLGKLSYDTKVSTIIPELQLYSPYVTSELTVMDLLTHRTGLGLGAGDLMVFSAGNTLTEADLIHNMRYLKPVSPFRTDMHYNNLMYIMAGEVVERVSGKPYEKFIMENFVEPLGMKSTVMNYKNIKDHSNEITGHAPVDGELIPVGLSFTDAANSAAGMWSSIHDMSKWVLAQLHHGKYGKNLTDSLFSKKVQQEMWSPQTIIDRGGKGAYNTHFSSVGTGWFLSDVQGHKEVTHSGGLLGIVTKVLMIPELNLGIIVFTNQQSGAAFSAIANSIKDGYLGIAPRDWIQKYHEHGKKRAQKAQNVVNDAWQVVENNENPADLKSYTGTFSDPWFGEVTISMKDGNLYFAAQKAKDLKGEMFYYKGNTFIVKWENRTFLADAFLLFSLDKEGKANAAKMSAVSPSTDFSFDFQDLNFERLDKKK